MGGAQAIAALAYGTETVRRVDKIVGPGNVWVTAAKQIVAGDVGIDGLPGPTEIVVFADATADAALVAADLLAQAEHDVLAAAILVTADRRFAKSVADQVERQLEALENAAVARESIARFGAALVVEDLERGLDLVEAIAPEHLQLMGVGPEAMAHRVSHAGAVVVGRASSAVFGDYVAGPSHVLPTAGSARWSSALGVDDFIRRSHAIRYTPEAARAWAETAATLADVEGLHAHAAAARRRLR
jgi:histidinol dehydrogenase